MFGGGKQKPLVGLDIGSSSIKAVELKGSKQGYELMSYGLEPLAQDTVVDGAIMDAPLVAAAITSIFERQKIKTKNVATSVSGHSVIVKRVTLPLIDRKSTRLNSSHANISYAVFCLKKKKKIYNRQQKKQTKIALQTITLKHEEVDRSINKYQTETTDKTKAKIDTTRQQTTAQT